MKSLFFLCCLLLSSCGKYSLFDNDYWRGPQEGRLVEEETDSLPPPTEENTSAFSPSFTVQLTSLLSYYPNITGIVEIMVNETDATSKIQLKELPHSLMYSQRMFSDKTCDEFSSSSEISISNSSTEFKELNVIELSSREALIAELNHLEPTNGENTDLEGKSLVVMAYVSDQNRPGPLEASVFPLACGNITKSP